MQRRLVYEIDGFSVENPRFSVKFKEPTAFDEFIVVVNFVGEFFPQVCEFELLGHPNWV